MTTRVKIVLACEACGERNYKTTRSSAPGAKALSIKKFCTHCAKHTLHHESR